MSTDKQGDWIPPAGAAVRSDHWIASAFLLFLAGLGGAAATLLGHDRRGPVLFIALLAGTSLWGLEYLGSRCSVSPPRVGNDNLFPAVLIVLATILLYLSTLNIYFLSDDFGCLHAFHHPSLSQFLKMFHTDLAQVVEGESGQEIRPFYALYYMVSYKLWGLDPRGYHVTGMLLHILNSLIVFGIAKDMAPGNSWRAGFAGLFFAVQPAHSAAVSWIAGSPAEGFPALFYLAAFLCFMRYRATNMARYLVLSVMAFSACLMCKEIAVTLPLMLVSYDLFQRFAGEAEISPGNRTRPSQPSLRFLLAYLPFGLLLLGYLEWRRFVFSHFLGEDFWESSWGGHLQGRVAGPAAFFHQLAHLGRYIGGHHAFNLRALLLPLPSLALGVVLGLYLVWAVSLLRSHEDRRALAIILYFGLVWYLISDLPLLVASPEARHLYLPAVGPCIATAFLAMPTTFGLRKDAGYSRLLGAALLVALFASQLWKENSQFAERGKTSAKGTAQIAAAVGTLPKQALVIIQFPGEGILPFALQPPFTSTDLYSQARIIELPSMCGCPLARWWEKTKNILSAELAGAPDAPMEINLLAWDAEGNSIVQSKRALPKGLVQDSLTETLGGPIETMDPNAEAAADKLVETLAELASKSR